MSDQAAADDVWLPAAPHPPADRSNPGLATATPDDPDTLRQDVFAHLRSLGLHVSSAGVVQPVVGDKARIRRLHREAVVARRHRAKQALADHEDTFVGRLARPRDLQPAAIRPRLVPVTARTPETLLWRWASLHWSIPTSAGYGRRLRYLVLDDAHGGALVGLIGLGDPVFALAARDTHLGWTRQQREQHLHQVMDAFVLGAVPPYAQLLGGKLVALLAASTTVRDHYREKYDGRVARISGRTRRGPLAAVTTTSALGRSSVYNRLTAPGGARLAYVPAGYTNGSGDFQFDGDIYDRLHRFVADRVPASASYRKDAWGGVAFRNRREVITRAFDLMGIDGRKMRLHGVRREVFVAPLAANYRQLLHGDHVRPRWNDTSGHLLPTVSQAADWWRDRWATDRADRDARWTRFDPESWRMWTPTSSWLDA